jgi:hypothetical protein
MRRSNSQRLAKLEAAGKCRKQVVMWNNHDGSAEREIARRQAAGETDVEFVTVGWLKSGEGERGRQQ